LVKVIYKLVHLHQISNPKGISSDGKKIPKYYVICVILDGKCLSKAGR